MAKVLSHLQVGFQYRNGLIDVNLDVRITCHIDLGPFKGGESLLVITHVRIKEFVVELSTLEVLQPILLGLIRFVRIQADVLLLRQGLEGSLVGLMILA